MSFAEHASPGDLVAPAVVVLASALALGGYFEHRRWALPVDVARQMAGIGLVASYAVDRFGAGAGIMIVIGLLLGLVGLFVGFRPDRT